MTLQQGANKVKMTAELDLRIANLSWDDLLYKEHTLQFGVNEETNKVYLTLRDTICQNVNDSYKVQGEILKHLSINFKDVETKDFGESWFQIIVTIPRE